MNLMDDYDGCWEDVTVVDCESGKCFTLPSAENFTELPTLYRDSRGQEWLVFDKKDCGQYVRGQEKKE